MEYEIKKVAAQPDWAAIPSLKIDYPYFDTPKDVSAFAQIAYTDEALLVHMRLVAQEIRNEEKGTLGMPCMDSCLEFFFCPMEGDNRYFNMEFNLGGCMFLGMGTSKKDLTRFAIDRPDILFSFRSARTEDGFEIDYQVPYHFIRRLFPDFKVYPGKRMRANCYSCAQKAERQHFLSWNPILGDPFTFHRTDGFGTMIFTEKR